MRFTIKKCSECPFSRQYPIPGGLKYCSGVFWARDRLDPDLKTDRPFDDYIEVEVNSYKRQVIGVYPSVPPDWCPLRENDYQLELEDIDDLPL